MMIKFSWKKINDKFGWNAPSVLQYLYMKRCVKPPFYLGRGVRKAEVEANKPFPDGDCFIRDIDSVLMYAKDPNHLYIYLELASKRSLFDYKMRGIVYLPLYFVPEYVMGLVSTNPMLEVKDDKIYFKYEQR